MTTLTKDNLDTLAAAADVMQRAIHGSAKAAGWWTNLQTGEDMTLGAGDMKLGVEPKRNVGELLCLVHSEISEAMEGHRKGRADDHLPDRLMIEVELADALIRIFDMAGGLGLDLPGAIAEKLAYNEQRADHKIENRRADGGKKY